MMRHPIETLPQQIDPWVFARTRRYCDGDLPLSSTQTLKQWASNGATLHAALMGRIDEYGQTCLSGRVRVLLEMQCQRCLQPMQSTIERDFDYVIIRDQALESRIEGAAESFVCSESELDVAWFLEEEVLLAMPMIAKHEDCSLPHTPADIAPTGDDERQYPFAALKDMMKSKEQ